MHEPRRDRDVRDLARCGPRRACGERHEGHQRGDERKADEQELERRRVRQAVLCRDEPRAPQDDEQPGQQRIRARAQSFTPCSRLSALANRRQVRRAAR